MGNFSFNFNNTTYLPGAALDPLGEKLKASSLRIVPCLMIFPGPGRYMSADQLVKSKLVMYCATSYIGSTYIIQEPLDN
jgi:hypothetical protein